MSLYNLLTKYKKVCIKQKIDRSKNVLTESRGNRPVRLLANFSKYCVGGSNVSIPTVAIFAGSPRVSKEKVHIS